MVACRADDDCPEGARCVAPIDRTRGICAPRSDAGAIADAGAGPLERRVVLEREAYAARTNDLPETAEPVTVGAEVAIAGTLGLHDGLSNDADHYRISLRGNRTIALTVTATAGIIPRVTLSRSDPIRADAERRQKPLRRILIARDGEAEREVFVPFDGSFLLRVEDERARSGEIRGGPDHAYRVIVREVKPTPAGVTHGVAARLESGARGEVRLLRIEITEPAVIDASALEETEETLQPALYLRQVEPRRLAAVIASGEESEQERGAARLSEVLDPGAYELVVDVEERIEDMGALVLSTRARTGSDEIEPNEGMAVAPAFHSPLSGELSPVTAGALDTDVFRFRGAAGRLITIEARNPSGEAPRFEILDGSGSVIARQPNLASRPSASLSEVLLPFDGLYFIRLSAGADAAGAQRYELRVTTGIRAPALLGAITSTETTLFAPGQELPEAGDRRWYRAVLDGLDEPVLVLETAADPRSAPFEPLFSLAGADGITPFGRSESSPYRRRLIEGEYWLSLTDRESRGTIRFDLLARALAVRRLDTPRRAGRAAALAIPDAVAATLAPGADDVYTAEPSAGACVDVETIQSSTEPVVEDVDTIVTLTSSTGSVIAEADDHGASKLSRVRAVPVPAGPLGIRVRGKTPSTFGEYVLVVERSPCPP